MTIAVGFQCKNSVLLAADTEISYGQAGKTYQTKLFQINPREDCWAVYSGVVDFMNELVGQLRQSTKGKSGTALVQTVRKAFRQFMYEHYTKPPKAEKTWANLLITVRENKKVSLYCATGRHFYQVEKYRALGGGAEQAEPLLNAMYSRHMDSLQAGYLAVYALRSPKGFVRGVGGDTDILAIEHQAQSVVSFAEWSKQEVTQAESDFAFLDKTLRPVLFAFPNLNVEPSRFRSLLKATERHLVERRAKNFRREEREQKKWEQENARLSQEADHNG